MHEGLKPAHCCWHRTKYSNRKLKQHMNNKHGIFTIISYRWMLWLDFTAEGFRNMGIGQGGASVQLNWFQHYRI